MIWWCAMHKRYFFSGVEGCPECFAFSYWQCPNDETHCLRFTGGLGSITLRCKICDIPARLMLPQTRYFSTSTETWRQLMSKQETIDLPALRQAVADYRRSEGCSCCEADDHQEHWEALIKLLNAPQHGDPTTKQRRCDESNARRSIQSD